MKGNIQETATIPDFVNPTHEAYSQKNDSLQVIADKYLISFEHRFAETVFARLAATVFTPTENLFASLTRSQQEELNEKLQDPTQLEPFLAEVYKTVEKFREMMQGETLPIQNVILADDSQALPRKKITWGIEEDEDTLPSSALTIGNNLLQTYIEITAENLRRFEYGLRSYRTIIQEIADLTYKNSTIEQLRQHLSIVTELQNRLEQYLTHDNDSEPARLAKENLDAIQTAIERKISSIPRIRFA